MIIIGLTGGIASGKSAVAAELAQLGAVVLDADQAAHKSLESPTVQTKLVARWGNKILDANGHISRAEVARIVFADNEKASLELRFLEQSLHPLIRKQFEQSLKKLALEGTTAAVIDAPLLLEAGWKTLCDQIVFVDSPRTERLQRAVQRNWTESEFTKREACQMPIAEKREQSTHVLDNLGSLADLRAKVRLLWHSLVQS